MTCLLWGGVAAHAQSIAFPADVAGLAFHINAYDINGNGTQPANGAIVDDWNDLSGNLYHISAPTGEKPSFESTGFDGLHPAVRFEDSERMFGPDILPTVSGQMTIFFVTNNVTLTKNFPINLNGNNTSATTQYSFHTPWSTNKSYFDAGASKGANRVFDTHPIPATETAIFTAWNDLAGHEHTGWSGTRRSDHSYSNYPPARF